MSIIMAKIFVCDWNTEYFNIKFRGKGHESYLSDVKCHTC